MTSKKSYGFSQAFDIIGGAPLEVVAMVFEYLGHTSALKYQQVSKTWRHKLSSDAAMKASLSTWSMSGDLKLSCEAHDKLLSKSQIFRKKVEQIQRFRLGIPYSRTCILLGVYGNGELITGQVVRNESFSFCGDVVVWIARYLEGYSRIIALNLKTSERFVSGPYPLIRMTDLHPRYLGWLTNDQCIIANLATSTSLSFQSKLPSGLRRPSDTFGLCALVGNNHLFAIYPMFTFHRDLCVDANDTTTFPVQFIDVASQNSWVIKLIIPYPCSEDSEVEMQLTHAQFSVVGVDALTETFTLLMIISWASEQSSVLKHQHLVWRAKYSLDGSLVKSYQKPWKLDLQTPSAALYCSRSMATDMADGRLTLIYCRQLDAAARIDQETFHMVLSDRRGSQLVTKLRYSADNRAKDVRENCHRPWKDVEVYVHKYRVLVKRSVSEVDFFSDNADRPDSNLDYVQKEMAVRDFLYPGCDENFTWKDARGYFCNEWFSIVLDLPTEEHTGRIHVSCFDPDFEFPTPANLALRIREAPNPNPNP